MSALCEQCGAPYEGGLTACRYCNLPYPAEMRTSAAPGAPAGGAAPAGHAEIVATVASLGPTRCKRFQGHVSRTCEVSLSDGVIHFTHGSPETVVVKELSEVRPVKSNIIVLKLRDLEIGMEMTPEHAKEWLAAFAVHRG